MTLSKTDRAALKAIAAVLPTTTDPDEIRAHADRIQNMTDGGNAVLSNLLWAAQWAVGDIGQCDDNELEDDIALALQAIDGVLDYRLDRKPKVTPRPAVIIVKKPDGTFGIYF